MGFFESSHFEFWSETKPKQNVLNTSRRAEWCSRSRVRAVVEQLNQVVHEQQANIQTGMAVQGAKNMVLDEASVHARNGGKRAVLRVMVSLQTVIDVFGCATLNKPLSRSAANRTDRAMGKKIALQHTIHTPKTCSCPWPLFGSGHCA